MNGFPRIPQNPFRVLGAGFLSPGLTAEVHGSEVDGGELELRRSEFVCDRRGGQRRQRECSTAAA